MTKDKGQKRSRRLGLVVSRYTILDNSAFLKRLLVGLADESIPVALICPPDCNVEEFSTGSVEVIRHPLVELPMAEWFNMKTLCRKLIRFGPTVLHCLCESRSLLTRRLARQLGTGYVLTINSIQTRWGQVSISGKRCMAIVAPTASIANSFRKAHPRLADRVKQIDVGTFAANRTACFGDSKQLASVVLAHPVDNASDFEKFLGAMRHLSIDGYEFMIVLMGSGKGETQLHKMLVSMELLEHVTLLPRLGNWISVLAAADVFVLPQPCFSFNPALIEAISVGAAVAACKGGVDDLIIDGQTAVVFKRNDELSIMNAVKGLLDRREDARKLAKRAQEHVRRYNSVSGMISGLLNVYGLAEKHGRT